MKQVKGDTDPLWRQLKVYLVNQTLNTLISISNIEHSY